MSSVEDEVGCQHDNGTVRASANDERDSGFSLIELIVVVSTLSIITLIGVLFTGNAIGRAHDAAVKQDMRQIGMLLETWKQQDGLVPHLMFAEHYDDERSVEQQLDKWSQVQISKDSYSTENPVNLMICKKRDGTEFSVVGWSKSGNGFAYQDGGVRDFHEPAGTSTGDTGRVCEAMGFMLTDENGVNLPMMERRWGSGWLYDDYEWRI